MSKGDRCSVLRLRLADCVVARSATKPRGVWGACPHSRIRLLDLLNQILLSLLFVKFAFVESVFCSVADLVSDLIVELVFGELTFC